jgi:hypothetical protein
MCQPIPASFNSLEESVVKQRQASRAMKMRSAVDGMTQRAHVAADFWDKELMEPSAIA